MTVAKSFFKKYETAETGETKIKFVSGSVEAACGLGLADGIVDLVETGRATWTEPS
jgi:ATP phosphoribosyltransferase